MQLTKQGVRDLDAIYRKKSYTPPTLTDHVCRQWRWFKPSKDAPEDQGPEMLCVVCKKLWYDPKIPAAAAAAPQVKSLEKLTPGPKKGKKKKEESLTKPTLKAPIV